MGNVARQGRRGDSMDKLSSRPGGRCVNLSAQTTQRPRVGGDDRIDKNKQRITIPPRTVATHITGLASGWFTDAIYLPNPCGRTVHTGYGTFALCEWISPLERLV